MQLKPVVAVPAFRRKKRFYEAERWPGAAFFVWLKQKKVPCRGERVLTSQPLPLVVTLIHLRQTGQRKRCILEKKN